MKPVFCNNCLAKKSYVEKEKELNKTVYQCSYCSSEFEVVRYYDARQEAIDEVQVVAAIIFVVFGFIALIGLLVSQIF